MSTGDGLSRRPLIQRWLTLAWIKMTHQSASGKSEAARHYCEGYEHSGVPGDKSP